MKVGNNIMEIVVFFVHRVVQIGWKDEIGAVGGDQQDTLVINEGDISGTDGVGALDQIYVVFTIITFIKVLVVFVLFISFTIRIEFLTWDILFWKFLRVILYYLPSFIA